MTSFIDQTVDTELLTARYGEPTQAPLELPETIRDMLNHRSVRSYLSDPLPDGTLEVLVAAAQSASTSSNLQTWSVVAVTDPERKARFAELAGNQNHIRKAPVFLVWVADLARLELVAQARGIPWEGLDYTEMFLVAAIDATLASQNAALAAEALGLNIVYIGGLRNHPEAVAELIGLPPRSMAVFGMCVGYADTTRPTAIKPRLGQDAVLHREQYDLEGQTAAIERYNETMERFYAQQNMQVNGDWSEHSARRVSGPAALSGRDRLVEALRQLGFALK
jgi:nitroreductase